jgi:hypothetical protein
MEETTMQKTERTERQDVYTRIKAQIVADLEKGVRPWVKPWNAEHAAGRITRPLRHNGQPYSFALLQGIRDDSAGCSGSAGVLSAYVSPQCSGGSSS